MCLYIHVYVCIYVWTFTHIYIYIWNNIFKKANFPENTHTYNLTSFQRQDNFSDTTKNKGKKAFTIFTCCLHSVKYNLLQKWTDKCRALFATLWIRKASYAITRANKVIFGAMIVARETKKTGACKRHAAIDVNTVTGK